MTTWSETDRIKALRQYEILDTAREEEFDDIVKLAAEICGVPISLISLVEQDRQWFKAAVGLDATQTPIEQSICAHAILQNDVFIVPDATQDPRFQHNPLVTGDPNLRFYAGAVLETPDYLPIGMLCVLDTKPKTLTGQQSKMLKALARQVMTQLELRRSLREKQESDSRLQLAFNAAEFAGIWNWDLRTNLLVTDTRFARLYGVDPELAAKGAPPKEYINRIHPEDMKRITPSIERIITSGGNYDEEYRLIQPGGSVRWVVARGYGHVNEEGKPVRFDGVAIDITARKLAETAESEAKEHLSLMVESAHDYAIISMNLTGSIVSWNTGAERMFGYKPEMVLGKAVDIIFTPEDRAHGRPQYELSTAAEKGRANDERWHLKENGERFYVSGIMASMHDAEGNIKGFVKIARDMTKEQKAQEALLEARNAAEAANIAKTEFLANMSHEIRTPMNAVIGLSNILAMSQPLTQKQKEYIKTLQMSADSLLALINDLLDIAKIEARTVDLEHIPFSLMRLVQETISMMKMRADEKGLDFFLFQECACIEKRLMVGDPTRLRQIMLNLCSNAIKFTDKGEVRIHISCTPIPGKSSEMIKLSVQDTGIGIASENVNTIFHKFVQADSSINRKYGGTGLGLAITKTLAEIMGGILSVESTLGVGSTFTIELPMETASREEVQESSGLLSDIISHASPGKFRPRILLVEDYAPNVLVATTFLEEFGYDCEVAVNGIEAVKKVKEERFIAVLMDVQMHGMNGLEATSHIRQYENQHNLPKCHIIGMTAHALSGDRERCVSAGMDDYIPKPFNPDELQQKLAKLLFAEIV